MKDNCLKYICEKLISFDPQEVEYNGLNAVGFVNNTNYADVVIFDLKDSLSLNFAFYSFKYDYEKIDELISMCENILNSLVFSMEFFVGEQSVFGGIRNSLIPSKISCDDIFDIYCNKELEKIDSLKKFILANNDVSVKGVNFNNTINFQYQIKFENGEFYLD